MHREVQELTIKSYRSTRTLYLQTLSRALAYHRVITGRLSGSPSTLSSKG